MTDRLDTVSAHDTLLIDVRKRSARMAIAEPRRISRFLGQPLDHPMEIGFILRTLVIDLAERRRTQRQDAPVDEWVQTQKLASIVLVLRYWRYVAHVKTRRVLADARGATP